VILRDQRAILTVCTPLDDLLGVKDVTVAMPNLLGGEGVIHTFSQPLNAEEQDKLLASAGVVKEAIEALD
jgi:L-lactate dehydrogenase